MKRFKNILVVCQEDCQPELSIQQATFLAKRNNASVSLVDIVSVRESELTGFADGIANGDPVKLKSKLTHYHQTRLNALGHSLREAGVETTVQVLWGIPFVEIIRNVIRNDHDLVIKSVAPPKPGERNLLGSIDMHLMRKCPCPVWILKERLDGRDLRVLAAVDPDVPEIDGIGLNRPIMELSKSMCDTREGQLHVLHTWALPEERALLAAPSHLATSEELDLMKSDVQRKHADQLNKLVAPYASKNDSRMHIHLVEGSAGDVVPEYAVRLDIDLVVMGSVNRTDMPGMFMGSTAEIILSRVDCSVLAVKPDNFKTPIELPHDPGETAENVTPLAVNAGGL